MNRTEARDQSAKFVRSLNPDARRLWEVPGPKNTDIWQMEAWNVVMPGDRPRVVVIQIFGARREEVSGWQALADVGPLEIDGTRKAFLGLGALERGALETIEPEVLEAVADEIGVEHKHTARAGSLRGVAKRQRAAMGAL